jgi:ABC-type uncharacterized transport system permease subunit
LLNRLLIVSSFTNVLAGAILFVTWASNWATDPERHVPIIVFAIGGAMMIQGLYSAGYTLGWWKAWGDLASGALLGLVVLVQSGKLSPAGVSSNRWGAPL